MPNPRSLAAAPSAGNGLPPPGREETPLKRALLFRASDVAWQLACLAESAREIGLEPPPVAVSGPEDLRAWITAQRES